MVTMFVICGILSTIIVIVYTISVCVARWLIKTNFGEALSSYLGAEDSELTKQYEKLSVQELGEQLAKDGFDLRMAILKKNFSSIAPLNKKFLLGMSILHDRAVKAAEKNENPTHL